MIPPEEKSNHVDKASQGVYVPYMMSERQLRAIWRATLKMSSTNELLIKFVKPLPEWMVTSIARELVNRCMGQGSQIK